MWNRIGRSGGAQIYWGQDAPQDPQDLELPSLEAPHLGQDAPCMVYGLGGLVLGMLQGGC